MKKYLVAGILISGILLAGCNRPTNGSQESSAATTISESTSSSTATVSTSSSEAAASSTSSSTPIADQGQAEQIETDAQLFNALDPKTQAALITSLADQRIDQYPGFEGMWLSYTFTGDHLISRFTSGVGSGHPIFLFAVNDTTAAAIHGVVGMGIDGFEEVPIQDASTYSKSVLYQKYLKNQGSYDTAVSRTEESPELLEGYHKQCELAGITPKI